MVVPSDRHLNGQRRPGDLTESFNHIEHLDAEGAERGMRGKALDSRAVHKPLGCLMTLEEVDTSCAPSTLPRLVPGWLAGLVDTQLGLIRSATLNVEAQEIGRPCPLHRNGGGGRLQAALGRFSQWYPLITVSF